MTPPSPAPDGSLPRYTRLRWASILLIVAAFVSLPGCGAVAKKNVALGLIATGAVASTTTGILGFGCTTPNPNNPQLESRGPCLPPETYTEVKPFLWTTFVLGFILAATGIAIVTTIDEKPRSADPPPAKPPPDPLDESSCKDAKYCY